LENNFFLYSLISQHRSSFWHQKSQFGLTKIIIFSTLFPY
jgi:hypothetical protein